MSTVVGVEVALDQGVTALLATHDPTLMDIADSVLHLTDGTIQRVTMRVKDNFADGKKETVVWKTGQVRMNEPSQAYTATNIGKTEIHLYVVQLK